MANRARKAGQRSPRQDSEASAKPATPGGSAPKTARPPRAAKPVPNRKRVAPPPPVPTGRYTPPIPKSQKVSPLWVPILMFGALGIGMAMIILNYVDVLPGGTSNGYLLGGLAFITLGFITATRYH